MSDSFRARVALSGLASLSSRVFSVGSTFVCARLLGTADFGRLSVWQATLTSAVSIGTVGLAAATNSLVARTKFSDAETSKQLVGTSVAMGVVAAGCCAALVTTQSRVISRVFPVSADTASELRLVGSCVFFGALNAVLGGVAAGLGLFKDSARVNLVGGALTLLLLTLGAYVSGVAGVLVGLICASLLITLQWIVALTRGSPGLYRSWRSLISRAAVRSLMGFALPSAVSAFTTAPIVWYATVLLTHSRGGIAEAGIFNAALSWNNLVVFLQLAISPALVTSMAERRSANDWKTYWDLFWKSVKATCVLSGGAAILISILAPAIMNSYGPSFGSRWPVLSWLMLGAAFSAITGTVANVIVTSSSMWWGALLNGIWALVFAGCALVLCPTHGAAGLAWTYAIAYGVHLLFVAIFIWRFRAHMRRSNHHLRWQTSPGE